MKARDSHNDPSSGAASGLSTTAAIGSILLWCWSGVCFRAGSSVIHAMPYLTLSSIVGVITIAVLYVCVGRPVSDLFRLPFRVIVSGFFGVAVYTVILVLAVDIASEEDIGQVMLINHLWPIWMVILGIALLDEKPRVWLAVGGALLGFGGVILAVGRDTFTRPPSSLLPHALSLAGAFLWALYSVLLKRWRIPEEKGGSTFHFMMCAILAAITATINGQWQALARINASTLFWILFLGVGPIGLGYYWWEIGIKRGAIHLIAVMAYFIPIGSALLIGLFFTRAMTVGLLPGAAMITAGAYLGRRATRYNHNKRTP